MYIKNEKVLNIKLFSTNPLLSPHILVKRQRGYEINKYIRKKKKEIHGASLVAQWLRIRLPMQETRVQALVWENLTCLRATKPVCHNY